MKIKMKKFKLKDLEIQTAENISNYLNVFELKDIEKEKQIFQNRYDELKKLKIFYLGDIPVKENGKIDFDNLALDTLLKSRAENGIGFLWGTIIKLETGANILIGYASNCYLENDNSENVIMEYSSDFIKYVSKL